MMKMQEAPTVFWLGIGIFILLGGMFTTLFAFGVKNTLANNAELILYGDGIYGGKIDYLEAEVDPQLDYFKRDMGDNKSLVTLSGNTLILDTEALSEKDIGISVTYPYVFDANGDLPLSSEDLYIEGGIPNWSLPGEKIETVLSATLQEDGTFIVIIKETIPDALNLGPTPTQIYRELYVAKDGKIVLESREEGTWSHRTIVPEHYEFNDLYDFDEATSNIASSDSGSDGDMPCTSE